MKTILCFLSAIVLPLFLYGCEDPKESVSKNVNFKLAGKNFCVPEKFSFMEGLPGKSGTSVLIAAQYPSFEPLEKAPKEIFKSGQQEKIVRILLTAQNRFAPMTEFVEEIKSSLTPFPAKDNFGLSYYAYDIIDRGEYFFEFQNEEGKSVTKCTFKASEELVPQCNYQGQNDSLHYSISFDRRLMPFWKEIREKTYALVSSFNCKKSIHKNSGE